MDKILTLIQDAIKGASLQVPASITVDRPDAKFGDFTTNVALAMAKQAGKSPRDIATIIAGRLSNFSDVAKAEVAGPGFINISMKDSWFMAQLGLDEKIQPALKGKSYIIEYSSPNIAKPMHVGHLRTTVLGQTLVNIYRMLDGKVYAWSHPGDWGTQFGKLIVAWRKWGDKHALAQHPIDELLRIYVKFHQVAKDDPELDEQARVAFKSLQDGDADTKKLWQQFVDVSEQEFDRMYKLLQVEFDIVRSESTYNAYVHQLVEDALAAKVAKTSEGAVIIPLDEYDLPPYLIQKSDGATLYATADLVSIYRRSLECKPDELIYVVGNEQTLHFQQLFAAAEKLAKAGVYGKENKDFHLPKLTHVSYGFFRLVTGKMSTRQGEVIRLDEVIEQAIKEARELLFSKEESKLTDKQKEDLAPHLGVWAVKYTDLMHDRHTDVVFDWQKMFAYEGNSIVYLLYTNARCNALLQATPESNIHSSEEAWTSNEKLVLLKALTLQSSLERSAEQYDPHFMLNHAYELASEFSRFYNNDTILKASPEVTKRRLKLVAQMQRQLHVLFKILGMKEDAIPERM